MLHSIKKNAIGILKNIVFRIRGLTHCAVSNGDAIHRLKMLTDGMAQKGSNVLLQKKNLKFYGFVTMLLS